MKKELLVLVLLACLTEHSHAIEAIKTIENVITMPIPTEEEINKKYSPLKNKDTTFISTSDLLDTIIEFVGLTPDQAMWSEKCQYDNLPRLYRIQQIHALFDAFGLNNQGRLDLEGFFRGDFVSDDNTPYKSLLDDMATAYESSPRSKVWLKVFNQRRDSVSVKSVFSYLFDFVVSLDRLSHIKGMIGHDAVASSFAYGLTGATRESMDPITVSDIMGTLAEIIDPKHQKITIRDLIEKHNYPDLNISDVDSDFW